MDYKTAIILFILFIVIQSEIFSDHVLTRLNGTIDSYGDTTRYGHIVQATVLVIIYSLILTLIRYDVM